MKKFLIRLILFALIIASFTTGVVLVSDYTIKQRKNILLKLSNDVDIVFAGNSTVECAVDDNLIARSVNIAQSGEAYLYSYVKIKALSEVNKQIKTVFLGFSYGDLLMDKEVTWLCSDEFIIEKVQYYNYLLDTPEKDLLIRNNPKAYFKGLTKSVFNSFISTLKSYSQKSSSHKLANFGGYKYLVRDKLKTDPGVDSKNEAAVVKSYQQEKYIKMISELCREHSIKLVLFNTPKHRSYYENVNKDILQIWYDTRNSLDRDSLLDLSTYELPDSCFGDLSHLNYRGAKLFSQYLNEIINQDPKKN
jgi:hypothetical protein